MLFVVVQGRPNLQLFNHLYWLLFSTIFVIIVRIQMNWLKNYPPQIINRKRKHQKFRENNQNLQMTFWLQVICQPIMKYLRGSFSGGCHYIIKLWQPGCEKVEREWENEEEMEREWGNGERMRKSREIHFLHFLIFSLFTHSQSISYIKNCLILLQNI